MSFWQGRRGVALLVRDSGFSLGNISQRSLESEQEHQRTSTQYYYWQASPSNKRKRCEESHVQRKRSLRNHTIRGHQWFFERVIFFCAFLPTPGQHVASHKEDKNGNTQKDEARGHIDHRSGEHSGSGTSYHLYRIQGSLLRSLFDIVERRRLHFCLGREFHALINIAVIKGGDEIQYVSF
jgi:hypothetical protein